MLEDQLTLAVLGDLHGHIGLALTILRKFERESQLKIDHILQVGDFGYFPEPFLRLDRATKKFADKDPEELGFSSKFLDRTETSEKYFNPANQEDEMARTVFIAGNHEDTEAISTLPKNSPYPVDHFRKFVFLPSGVVYEIQKGKLTIKVAGLGGVSKEHGFRFSHADIRKVKSLENIDILLTHEPQTGVSDSRGSEEVKEVLDSLQPSYHFCGHFHIDGQELPSVRKTRSYILNEVNFRKRHALNKGCIGILKIKGTERSFEILDKPWLKQYTAENYAVIS